MVLRVVELLLGVLFIAAIMYGSILMSSVHIALGVTVGTFMFALIGWVVVSVYLDN